MRYYHGITPAMPHIKSSRNSRLGPNEERTLLSRNTSMLRKKVSHEESHFSKNTQLTPGILFRVRALSEKAFNLPVFVHKDAVRSRHSREARHRHYLATDRDHELSARGESQLPDGHHMT